MAATDREFLAILNQFKRIAMSAWTTGPSFQALICVAAAWIGTD
jgi:hypothetical protein